MTNPARLGLMFNRSIKVTATVGVPIQAGTTSVRGVGTISRVRTQDQERGGEKLAFRHGDLRLCGLNSQETRRDKWGPTLRLRVESYFFSSASGCR